MNLSAGKIVYDLLKSTPVAASFTKICPLVVEKATNYPFVVYKRMGNNELGTKDGIAEETTTVEVKIVHNKYFEGVELAQKVADALTRKNYDIGDIYINSLEVTDADEDYVLDAFVQTLSFTLKTIKN